LQSQLAITEGQLFELMARRGRLSAERDSVDTVTFDDVLISVGTANPDISELIKGQTNLFFARRDSVAREAEQLGKREAQIGNQIAGIDAQKTSLARQLELIQQELEAQETLLDRGLAQRQAQYWPCTPRGQLFWATG
jgi:HlyD family secretion protein